MSCGEKKSPYEKCGKLCSQEDLQKYMLLNNGQKNSGCTESGKLVSDKRNPQNYLLVQNNVGDLGHVKKFRCDICGKLFLRKNVLQTHLVMHSDVKEFECDICGKQFFQKGMLMAVLSFGMLLLLGYKFFTNSKQQKCLKSQEHEVLMGMRILFVIQHIFLCPESRLLCVAGATAHVILFKYSKQKYVAEIPCLEIPIMYEVYESGDCSPEYEFPPHPTLQVANSPHHTSSAGGSLR